MAFWNRRKREAPDVEAGDAGEVQKSKRTENRVLNRIEIMWDMLDWCGRKFNGLNGDGVCGTHSYSTGLRGGDRFEFADPRIPAL